MKALPHQVKKAGSIVRKLRLYGLCLFAGEVRSGKTAAFILAAQRLCNNEFIIITKKGAIPGVQKFTPNVTNYHQAGKLEPIYKVVILDECHRYITGYPKRSTIWKDIAKICANADYIIFSSGTPTPESYAMLFNMLALSPDSPWSAYKTYSKWHNDYGIPYKIKVANDLMVKQWDKVKDHKVLADIEHLQISMTRTEAGHKFEPTDKLHHIPLTKYQDDLYKALNKYGMYELPGNDLTILADTASKLNQKKHQISGGYVNAVNDLNESETEVIDVGTKKVRYIMDNFDPEETIILAYYIPEQEYLATKFPNVGSITKNSDGVDYSHFKNMVIYSMGFSAATYQQVIGRQLNFITRKEEVVVHFLLSGIDEDVYRAVAIDKKNFTSKWYYKKEDYG